jgi:hypothetical protein
LASGSAKPSEGMNIKHPNQSGKTFARDLVDPPGNDASCETVPKSRQRMDSAMLLL